LWHFAQLRVNDVGTLGCIVTPQPVCIDEPAIAVCLAENFVADETCGAFHMPELSPETANSLDAAAAWSAFSLHLREYRFPIEVASTRSVGSEEGDSLGVFHGHDRA